MKKDRVLGLLRFSRSSYIDDFVNGKLYMNTLQFFSAVECTDPRWDKYEGAALWLQPSRTKLSMKSHGNFVEIRNIVGPISHSIPPELLANVFCMYAVRESTAQGLFDSRLSTFGETFVLLKDGDEFIRRVIAAAQNLRQRLQYSLVEYVDAATYEGPMGIFRKSGTFSFQSEFRIALLPGVGEPYVLDVGNLSDLCFVGATCDLSELVKLG